MKERNRREVNEKLNSNSKSNSPKKINYEEAE